jgi:oxygen-dependent protoporphyrinogen oxidase
LKAIIIGGGISGLCTGFRLKQKGIDVKIFDTNSVPGGFIHTEFNQGFLLEYGPNSIFSSSPEVQDLIDDLDLNEKVLNAKPASKKRYILKNGKLVPVPVKPLEFLNTDLISFPAKLRVLKEFFVKVNNSDDESIADFVRRRVGKEFLTYLINPFVAGVYAGNPEELSLKSTFPMMHELEKKYGGLIKGALKRKKNKNKKKTGSISFKEGMQTLIDALYENLHENIILNTKAGRIFINDTSFNKRFTVRASSGSKDYEEDADAVIISTPAGMSSDLMRSIDANLSGELKKIVCPPISIVYLAFKKEDVNFNIDGFGFLVPEIEKRNILGCLWNSETFAGRAPEKFHLFTTFIGGSKQPELALKNEDELIKIALGEVKDILGIQNDPVFKKVKKWETSIPQYKLGYFKLVNKIDGFKKRNRGIFFCNNFYNGISVSDCIRNSMSASDEVSNYLQKNHSHA